MRRLVDVAVSLLALVLLSPLLLLSMLAVRLALGSPLIFRQLRTGRNGRQFTIYKLRTMRAERFPGEPDGDRTGRVGRWLRATSLDELPQLVNVLLGHMSLVGPRPTLPDQVRHYTARQHRRHEIRPGITGWAQVNGRNSLSWPERIELDIWYIDHRSLALDLRIVGHTLLRLVRPSGLYGENGVNPGYPETELDPGADRRDRASDA